jgi:hypothetical protein
MHYEIPTKTVEQYLNASPINSFQAIVLLTGQEKGVLFYGGESPSKIGPIAPYKETVQALSKARPFLLSYFMSRVLCMACS